MSETRSTSQAGSSSYADRLSKSKEAKESGESSFKVDQTKLEIQASKLTTKAGIAREKKRLDSMKDEHPLDIDGILELELEIEDMERGFNALGKLETELFPVTA